MEQPVQGFTRIFPWCLFVGSSEAFHQTRASLLVKLCPKPCRLPQTLLEEDVAQTQQPATQRLNDHLPEARSAESGDTFGLVWGWVSRFVAWDGNICERM